MTIRYDKKKKSRHGREGGQNGWLRLACARDEGVADGRAKGARGCATTTPQPPANSAAARRSARSTGSNATTAYNTSPSRSPAVYLAAATLLRSARIFSLSVSRCYLSFSSVHHHPQSTRTPLLLSFTCVHTQGMMRVSPLSSQLTPRGNASSAQFAAGGSKARAVLFRVVELPRRNSASRHPTSTSAKTFRHVR